MRTVSIDPVTRLEGHARIDLFVDDDGRVANAYVRVPELRGFERFCIGRPLEELPRIMTRICGICPEAHNLASAKACDAAYGVEPPPAAVRLRRLIYNAFFVADHSVHFYILSGPDFLVGPDAPAAERIKFYVNNLETSTPMSNTTLTGLTNLDANALGLLFAHVADSSFGDNYLDWWRCVQLG